MILRALHSLGMIKVLRFCNQNMVYFRGDRDYLYARQRGTCLSVSLSLSFSFTKLRKCNRGNLQRLARKIPAIAARLKFRGQGSRGYSSPWNRIRRRVFQHSSEIAPTVSILHRASFAM